MDMDKLRDQIANADPFQSWWPFILAGAVFLITIIRYIIYSILFIKIVVLYLVHRQLMGGQLCPIDNNIDGQVVIVTGSSGGIGLEIVKELCRRGAHVIMACRDLEKTEKIKHLLKKEMPSCVVYVRYLDLRSFDCIRRFVNVIGKNKKVN